MNKGSNFEPTFDESVRYWKNARSLLARCRTQDGFYEDLKPVREAFGTAWLAVDTAVKAALQEKGLSGKQLPRSWEPLVGAVGKHLAQHNGKLIKLLYDTYRLVHLAGYYYADLNARSVAESAMGEARRVIEKLSRRRIS